MINLNLSFLEKTCYVHVIEAVKGAKCLTGNAIVTQSAKIKDYCENNYPTVEFVSDMIYLSENVFIISGRKCLCIRIYYKISYSAI